MIFELKSRNVLPRNVVQAKILHFKLLSKFLVARPNRFRGIIKSLKLRTR